MRHSAMRFSAAFIAAVAIVAGGNAARANKLDLSLARFIDCDNATGSCTANIDQYEIFMAEYAFGLAPKLMAPAETLGYSGFYLGLEGTLTPRPGTNGSQDRWTKGTAPAGEYPDVMFMPAVHVRKGLPWSWEIGGTINYLAQSELVGLGAEVKWSLFEGYRNNWRGFLPDIAARGSVVRVLGESDVDMTLVGVDGSISYAFGIGGMVTLTPYLGFQYLWTIIRIEPLVYRDDADPDNPVFHPPDGANWDTRNLSGPNLGRSKLFGGFRFGYEMLAITFELGWGLKKDWETSDIANPVTVEVGHQIQVSGGVGIDF